MAVGEAGVETGSAPPQQLDRDNEGPISPVSIWLNRGSPCPWSLTSGVCSAVKRIEQRAGRDKSLAESLQTLMSQIENWDPYVRRLRVGR
jgi:hypothetical protein